MKTKNSWDIHRRLAPPNDFITAVHAIAFASTVVGFPPDGALHHEWGVLSSAFFVRMGYALKHGQATHLSALSAQQCTYAYL